jgi:hypothetical protein
MIQSRCDTLNDKLLKQKDLFKQELEKATAKLSANVNENN